MITIVPVLYQDPQTQPEKPCPRCGCATYAPGFHCIRCHREQP